MGIFTPRLSPFSKLLALAFPAIEPPQIPEPSRTSSGTRITDEPPFVYCTSTVPLLPTAHCSQDKMLGNLSNSLLLSCLYYSSDLLGTREAARPGCIGECARILWLCAPHCKV